LERFKRDDGTLNDMVVQKELEQASENFEDKLLKIIKDMMCFDQEARMKIIDVIEKTSTCITILLLLC